jgi:NhaP-type Na+/H+ or K+/H+ antiporter
LCALLHGPLDVGERRLDYTAGARSAKAGLDLVNITQLLIGLPVGLVLLWAAWWLHGRMFRRPGERMSMIDAVVLLLMAGMGLLLALSLWWALD